MRGGRLVGIKLELDRVGVGGGICAETVVGVEGDRLFVIGDGVVRSDGSSAGTAHNDLLVTGVGGVVLGGDGDGGGAGSAHRIIGGIMVSESVYDVGGAGSAHRDVASVVVVGSRSGDGCVCLVRASVVTLHSVGVI